MLFKPQTALRVRANLNTDTPLPPDEPAGENPPDGAMIDYFLSKDASGPVTIEIKDGKGQLVRKYSSADKPVEANPKRLRIPSYWIRPPQSVSTKAGMHRFLWDMHYTPIAGVEPEFPISATYRNTAPQATSPWVAPGDYTVTLTVDGKTFTQPLTVVMDPRVKASAADLQEQFDLSWRLYQLRLKLAPIGKKFDDIAEQLTKLKARAAERPDVTQKLEAFAQTLMKFGPPHPRPGAPPSLFVLDSTTHLFDDIQGADAAPTAATKAAVADLETKVGAMMDAWRKLLESDLPALNQQLKQAGFPEIKTEADAGESLRLAPSLSPVWRLTQPPLHRRWLMPTMVMSAPVSVAAVEAVATVVAEIADRNNRQTLDRRRRRSELAEHIRQGAAVVARNCKSARERGKAQPYLCRRSSVALSQTRMRTLPMQSRNIFFPYRISLQLFRRFNPTTTAKLPRKISRMFLATDEHAFARIVKW